MHKQLVRKAKKNVSFMFSYTSFREEMITSDDDNGLNVSI
jgi:hypothetical protein